MRARLINEAVDKDSDIAKIKDYAEKHNLNFGINKNGTPYISLDVYYGMMKSFDKSMWPALITRVIYTFTYPDDLGSSNTPISLRKIWYGYEDELNVDTADEKLFVMQIEYLKKNMNEGIKHLAGRTPKEILRTRTKLAKQYVEELSVEEKKDLLRIRNLKQSLMGRFATIEKALEKVSMNYPKELKKSKK